MSSPLAWINSVLAVVSGLGLGAWIWLLQNRYLLPNPESKKGISLLREYSFTSHSIFLFILICTTAILTFLIRKNQAKPIKLAPLQWIAAHPWVAALWAGYAFAMLHGTSWFYPELVRWYREIPENYLLNNFSLRIELFADAMKRDDFRFFPLAHQDLHILSWFTAYVKVWMLVSAAELFAIVVLSARFIRRITGRASIPALLTITSLLLMFQPSTGTAFFQFIYSERLLTFLFCLYFASYLHNQRSKSQASFYSTILFGLIGIFIKDIAIVLFIAPPLITLALGSIDRMEGYPRFNLTNTSTLAEHYRLELWLCSLTLVFVCFYIVLSLLPSTYAAKGAYSKGGEFMFRPDWRFWLISTFTAWRALTIALGRIKANLLDGLNIAVLLYGAALFWLIGWQSNSYLALPIQLITVLDALWVWSEAIAPTLQQRSSPRLTGAIGVVGCLGWICLEHLAGFSFLNTVANMKTRQDSWQQTYTTLESLAREQKANGADVNIIRNRTTWFSRKSHLGRLPYDRLIIHDPEAGTYTVEDGIGEGDTYTPQSGDLLINIDREARDFTAPKPSDYSLNYRYAPALHSGRIYRKE